MAAVRVRGSATESAIVVGSQIGAGETRLDLAGELDLATAPMRMGDWGGALGVVEPPAVVRRVFQLCGGDDLLMPREALARAWPRPARQGVKCPPARPARAPAMVEPMA